jgi:predicted transport protein
VELRRREMSNGHDAGRLAIRNSPHQGDVAMTDNRAQFGTMPETLEQKTGRSLEGWLEIVRAMGLERHGQIMAELKQTHGLTHGYSNMLALIATGYGQAAEEDLVEGLFTGTKAGLRPIYDRLLETVVGFGGDVEVAPKKTMVGFKRKKQFACFTPSSAKRAEVGIALRGTEATERLRGSNGMTSHAVWIAKPDEIDDEVVGWLRRAYETS